MMHVSNGLFGLRKMTLALMVALGVAVATPSLAAIGELQWSLPIGGNWGSSTALDRKNYELYVGSADNSLYKVNFLGQAQWHFRTQGAITGAPAISADSAKVYIGSYDYHLYALDAKTGEQLWRLNTGGEVFASPTLSTDGTVFVGNKAGNFLAVDADTGLIKWQYTIDAVISSSAAIDSHGYVFFGASDGNLYAINPADAENGSVTPMWTYQTNGAVVSPALGYNNDLYVGTHGDSLYSLNTQTGAVNWSLGIGGRIMASPVIDYDGTLYVGNYDNGGIYAVSPEGELLWVMPLTVLDEDVVYPSLTIAQNGRLYVGDSTGESIYEITPALYSSDDPQQMITDRVNVDSPILATPIIDDLGTLYVATKSHHLIKKLGHP